MHRIRRPATMRALARLACLFLLPLTLAAPGVALAHELVSSSPADGEIVTDPSEIVLTFDEAIGASSTFEVKDASGAVAVSGGPDPADALVMRASIADLGPGAYHVEWLTLDDSGSDPHRGTFDFTIAAPAPPTQPPAATDEPMDEPSASPAPPPTPGPTGAPTPSPAPSVDGGASDSGSDVLLPIAVVGLVIGGGLAFFLRRRGAA